ncbi:MAG: hypothetical protein WC955_12970 [Elusimicrobiota bacterium]
MNILKRSVFFIIIISVYTSFAYCSNNTGGTPGYFLENGLTARELALGGASVAGCTDSAGVLYNPACIALVPGLDIQALYSALYENVHYSAISAVVPIRTGDEVIGKRNAVVIGGSFVQLYSGGYEVRDEFNQPGESFGITNSAYIFSAGLPIGERFAIGVGGRSFEMAILNQNLTAYALNCGLWAVPLKYLSAGVVLNNFVGSGYTRLGLVEKFPMVLNAGLVLDVSKVYPMINMLILSDLAYDISSNGGLKTFFGVEYKIVEVLSIRAGYDNENLTAGAGILINNFRFDYAVVAHKDMGFMHKVSGGYTGGITRKNALERPTIPPKTKNADKKVVAKKEAQLLYDMAGELSRKGRNIIAKEYLSKALEQEPGNPDFLALKDQIEFILTDTIPPVFKIASRELYFRTLNPLLTIPVMDNVGIKGVTVNNRDYNANGHTFEVIEVPLSLTKQETEVEVFASDLNGNKSSGKYIIRCDTIAPQIALINDDDFITDKSTYTLRLMIKENVKLQSISFNNRTFDFPGRDYIISEDIPLNEGENTVEITARDIAGNEGREQIVIVREPRKVNIALSDLFNRNVTSVLSSDVGRSLRETVEQNDRLKVTPRTRMLKVLGEKRAGLMKCESLECGIQLGKVFDVDYCVVGSVSRVENFYYINTMVVIPLTGEVILSDMTKANSQRELLDTAKRVAQKIIDIVTR